MQLYASKQKISPSSLHTFAYPHPSAAELLAAEYLGSLKNGELSACHMESKKQSKVGQKETVERYFSLSPWISLNEVASQGRWINSDKTYSCSISNTCARLSIYKAVSQKFIWPQLFFRTQKQLTEVLF